MFIGETIGPFRIRKELGSGAMGTVYRADFLKDDETNKIVALKIVALGLLGNEGAMARFEREASILKQLRHPNIVRLIATGRYKKTPFIAMEFVEGEPLDRMLARRGRIGWEEVVGYVKQLCDALQYAHDKGIIHRDLKPSNLMIMSNGTLKLTDFGIAKDQDVTALTGANSTIGTAAYMSPEQCRGEKNITGKSDLYSLGVVMYELITGRKPFTAETTVDMFLKHVHEQPVRPSRIVQDLPVWVETLVMHLLEKDKDRRPLDAATVRRMLVEIEEKVAAQVSAGAAVASARRIDRKLNDASMDKSDLEAARELRRGGRKRKKKKAAGEREREGVPWLRMLPVLLGLMVVAGALIYFLRPSGAEKLYAEIIASKSPEETIDKAGKYLAEFASDDDAQTLEVRAKLREARGRKLENVMANRFRTKRFRTAQELEDAECYGNAWAALEAEERGDLPLAAEFWRKVRGRGETVTDQYSEGWAWLADAHLDDIKKIDGELQEIRKQLAERDVFGGAWSFDVANPHSVATAAVRLGGAGGPPPSVTDPNVPPLPAFRDEAKTAKLWGDLSDLTKGKADQRAWHLLARREILAIGEKKLEAIVEERPQRLREQLDRIRKAWEQVVNDPNLEVARRDCRNRCRDLVELFADETDPQSKAVVMEARELFKVMTKPEGNS